MKIKRSSNSLELIHHWYEPYHKTGCLFFLIWDLLCIVLFFPTFISLLEEGGNFPINIIALCTLFILVPAPSYWMLVYIINRTKIRLTRSKITIENGPLPWHRANHSFPVQYIKYIWVEEKFVRPVIGEGWHGKADEASHVKAIMKSGKPEYLFKDIQNPEDTLMACSLLTQWVKETKRINLEKESVKNPPAHTNHCSNAKIIFRSKEDE